MNKSESAKEVWSRLYIEAESFKKMACWEWIDDTQIFGVKNPANGEIGYCLVFGSCKEIFALVLYLGTEGLKQIIDMKIGGMTTEEIMHNQTCLMASFENREDLTNQDRKKIKELGLKFRGRNQWPMFRNFKTGFYPWYIDLEEAQFLAIALEQAREIALRVKDKPDLLEANDSNKFLIKVLCREKDIEYWQDQWLEPELTFKKNIEIPMINEIKLKRIKGNCKRMNHIWEMDYFYSPTPVQDNKERPYYPYISMVVDEEREQIINFSMSKHEDYVKEFQETLIDAIEKYKILPRAILVEKQEAKKIIESITQRLNINVKVVDRTNILEEAKIALFEDFIR